MLSNGGCAESTRHMRYTFASTRAIPMKEWKSPWFANIQPPNPNRPKYVPSQDPSVRMLQYEEFCSENGEIKQLLQSTFTNSFRKGYVRTREVCLPEYYKDFGDQILDMDVRDDDVWMCSFPKSGE
uniref:Uncharacterized protein n=1 Tax=Cacopsylla melanoneura TaxID=428564 RepID=A0A8D8Q3E7_9HEMI